MYQTCAVDQAAQQLWSPVPRRLETDGSRYATPVLSVSCVACRSEEIWRETANVKTCKLQREFATVGRIYLAVVRASARGCICIGCAL